VTDTDVLATAQRSLGATADFERVVNETHEA